MQIGRITMLRVLKINIVNMKYQELAHGLAYFNNNSCYTKIALVFIHNAFCRHFIKINNDNNHNILINFLLLFIC